MTVYARETGKSKLILFLCACKPFYMIYILAVDYETIQTFTK